MPENDSQQDELEQKQDDSEKIQVLRGMAHRAEMRKVRFNRLTLKYGGTARFAPQCWMIQHGLDAFKSHNMPDAWRGICGILSVEWIKEHMRGGDFIKNVLRFTNVLIHKEKWAEKDKLFFKSINPTMNVTYMKHLWNFCRSPQNRFSPEHPISDYKKPFKRGQYQIITTKVHAMASCVYKDGTVYFYCPSTGEARGLSSTKFIKYFLKGKKVKVLGCTPLIDTLSSVNLHSVHRRASFGSINSLHRVHKRASFG